MMKMKQSSRAWCFQLLLLCSSLLGYTFSFSLLFLPKSSTNDLSNAKISSRNFLPQISTRLFAEPPTPPQLESKLNGLSDNFWENLAMNFVNVEEEPSKLKEFAQVISLFRVVLPALGIAGLSNILYPYISLEVAAAINDSGVFAVVAQDASQYIQNILTTSGLVFSLLVGQTYYFMYQQQEAIYLALFEEVTMAKSLLEQVALVCQGRESLYERILQDIDRYVKEDLTLFNSADPAELIAARPVDDPLENILYLTSVGEPSIIYQTVRSLRQARAFRLGALQRKLPPIHNIVLYALAGIVLFTFPLLGAGSQTIGGMAILRVQAWYLSFIVFGISLTMGVINELQNPGEQGAYNARAVLSVMVCGLEEELQLRMDGKIGANTTPGPSVDSDGAFEI